MIGTAAEMLIYFSYSREEFRTICSTNETTLRIRNQLAMNKYSEASMSEWLQRLGCTCIRPEVIVPAVIIDRHGRVFDEHTFVRLYITDFVKKELKRKLKLDNIIVKGGYLHERALKIFLKKKKAYVDTPRIILPSIWYYENSFGMRMHPRISQTIGSLIGKTLPHK